VTYPGFTPVDNATLVGANVLTCNKHSQICAEGCAEDDIRSYAPAGLLCAARSMLQLLLPMSLPWPSTPSTLMCGSAWATATCGWSRTRRHCR
jgi:hypothetical protein